MMPRISRWILGLTAACAAVACGDRLSTEPTPDGSAAPALARQTTSEVVALLKRTDPLPDGLSESAIIGPSGGHIQIERAGLRVDFPRGAVAKPTRITVFALRGSNVAYRFEPHGLVFQEPVTVSQSLKHTAAWKNPTLAAALQGSYFERLLVDPTETFARSDERRPGKLKNLSKLLEFTVEHFSGYMVSAGGELGVGISVEVEIVTR